MRVGLLALVGLALSAQLAAAQGTLAAPANEDCLACHGDPTAVRASGKPVSVDPVVLAASVHGPVTCVSCHADLAKQSEWPHAEKLAPATCAACHATAFQGYIASEHGRGRLKSGLNVAPDCATCHGSHDVRRIADPESATHRTHVATTCARCHEGILPKYEKSVHAQQVAAGNTAAAVCSDCHTSHRVQRAESDQWKLAVVSECGTCHVDRIATYRDTYHGKVTELGFTRVATCASCHSNHAILRASDPASTVAPANLVTTCRQCHAGANANFVKYNPHADKDDRESNPALHWASRGMQWLLGGVFLFFGAHTLLWFPRSWKARRERDAEGYRIIRGDAAMSAPVRHLVRFKPYQRLMHMAMLLAFLGLAATGLPLLFSSSPWAARFAGAVGGASTAGAIHRFFAFGMLVVFASHVSELAWRLVIRREPGLLWGPSSMVPQPRDLVHLAQHVRWFAGAGPRPQFDRYTYWEKFDYWAVFWGMVIIGGSGLLLWFPAVFSAWVPGWFFNVALLVHGEEALLATGFIFTIHFFNSHFRPEKFPMDMVMFTGQVSEAELARERPAEYHRLVRQGRLDALTASPEPPWVARGGRVIGTFAVATGLVLLVLIVLGFFFY